VDIDTATLAGALGVPVAFPEDEPAICTGARLHSLEQARDLEPADISAYPGVQTWLEAVRLLKQYFRDEVFLRGNCDQCPYSLASSLRGGADWMTDIMDPGNREDADRLLEFCLDATTQFVRLMSATGAHMISNGDALAGTSVVSPSIYRTFAQPYERRVVEVAHALGLPYGLHICGKTERILDAMLATGADALELDFKTDAQKARDALSGGAAFIGNLDPTGVLAMGSPRDVEEKTRELMRIFAGVPGFILNAGCAIPATTPSENIRAMIGAARESFEESYVQRA
jgi:uroporphyrinogen decarboxylase